MPDTVLKFILPLLILAGGIGGYVYMLNTKPRAEPVRAEEKAWSVAAIPVQLENRSPTLTLYGRVESPEAATLSAAVGAEVLEVLALEGQQVTQGQVLARLERRDLELLLAQRRADLAEIEASIASENNLHANNQAALPREQNLLALTEKSLERARQLEKQQVGSQSALDEARLAVERQSLSLNARQLEIKNHAVRLAQLQARQARTEALVAQAELDLSRCEIRAPHAGIVARMRVAPGNRVRQGDPLLDVYQTGSLEVRAQIPANHQRAAFDLLAEGRRPQAGAEVAGKPVRLLLHRLAGEVKAHSGGIDGLFRVEQGAQFLRLGQFVELRLELPAQEAVAALPFEALYGGKRVYKVKDGRMAKVAVERLGEHTGADGQTRVLVRGADLQAGDWVIVTQLPNAIDGLKITLWKEKTE
jgi:multidrug efflux pump subunit AcrA (membrane-fusion protein)